MTFLASLAAISPLWKCSLDFPKILVSFLCLCVMAPGHVCVTKNLSSVAGWHHCRLNLCSHCHNQKAGVDFKSLPLSYGLWVKAGNKQVRSALQRYLLHALNATSSEWRGKILYGAWKLPLSCTGTTLSAHKNRGPGSNVFNKLETFETRLSSQVLHTCLLPCLVNVWRLLGCSFSASQPHRCTSQMELRATGVGHSSQREVARAAAAGDSVAWRFCLLAGSCVLASRCEMWYGWNGLGLSVMVQGLLVIDLLRLLTTLVEACFRASQKDSAVLSFGLPNQYIKRVWNQVSFHSLKAQAL